MRTSLFFVAHGIAGTVLEINGAAENLFCAVHQRPGGVDLAFRMLAEMVYGQIHIQLLLPPAQIANVRLQPAAVALQDEAAVGVQVSPAHEHLDQLDMAVFLTVAIDLIMQKGTLPGVLQLHQTDDRVPARHQRGAQVEILPGLHLLINGDAGSGGRLHLHLLAAEFPFSPGDDTHRAARFGGKGLRTQIGGAGFVPFNHSFIHIQPVPRPDRELIHDQSIIRFHGFFHRFSSFRKRCQPMLPFISRRIRLFISTAYSTGSSLDTLSAKPLTISARASSSDMPRLIR